jgi:ABC-type antimicrobial peptide transport system permease subunit
MLFENIRLAFRSFSTNRTRAFLSVLGIVIGVASVIAITTMGRSATLTVQAEIARSGMGTIVVVPVPGDNPQLIRLFTPELASRIQRAVGGIEAVMPMFVKNILVTYGASARRENVMAVSEDSLKIFELKLAEGRFLSALDRERRDSVVVLGAEAASALFPTSDPIGKRIRLYLEPMRSFEVVGVLDSHPNALSLSFDSAVYVPFDTYSRRVQQIRHVQRYAIGVTDRADVIEVSRRVEDFFYELTRSRSAYNMYSPSAVAEMFHTVTSILNAFLTAIAAISLLVGGIGIMNIMIVSVTERTREIGIRKALGASPAVIRGQFLTEAVTLTMFGGVLGIVFGTVLSYGVTWMFGWAFVPSFYSYPLALLFSSVVGIFFGLYPAIRASRLDPVQALMYE